MTETISHRDLGGRHRHPDDDTLMTMRVPRVPVDETPTETLPTALGSAVDGEQAPTAVDDPEPDTAELDGGELGAATKERDAAAAWEPLDDARGGDRADDVDPGDRADPDDPDEEGDDRPTEAYAAVEETAEMAAGSAAEPSARAVPSARTEPPARLVLADRPTPAAAARSTATRRRIVAGVAAAVVLALVVWVALAALSGNGQGGPRPGQVAVAAPVAFGKTVVRADGWSVEVDRPAVLRQADDVELPSGVERAVQMDVTLTNTTDQVRDSAGWVIKATVGTRPVELLPEGVGTVPSRTVRPGASLTFPVVVPVSGERVDLQMEAVLPGGAPVLFVGPV